MQKPHTCSISDASEDMRILGQKDIRSPLLCIDPVRPSSSQAREQVVMAAIADLTTVLSIPLAYNRVHTSKCAASMMRIESSVDIPILY